VVAEAVEMIDASEQIVGVVIELDGKFWGLIHDDGRSTSYGWGPLQKAQICDPKYCKQPTDATYPGSHYEKELRRSRLLPARKTTTWEVEA
jgi:hypothetical protein